MLCSHGLLCRQKDSFTRTSVLHQVHLPVLFFDNGMDTDRPCLSLRISCMVYPQLLFFRVFLPSPAL